MPKWTDYTIKAEPADNDEVMVLDTAGKANKRLGLSALSDWVLGKIADKVFKKLQTNDKTILGAINELNSNPFLRYSRTYGTSLIIENVCSATHGLILIDNSLITFYISGSASIGYKIITSQLPDGVTVNNTNKTITIIIPDEGVITCFYAYIK